jgi:hypothetical protein
MDSEQTPALSVDDEFHHAFSGSVYSGSAVVDEM